MPLHLKNFLIRNIPATIRQLIVKARNLGRKLPSNAVINEYIYSVSPHKFWIQFNSGKWEPDLRLFYQRHISPTKTVLDIGGWQGASMFVACSLNPKKVIVVEANPKTFRVLKDNVTHNNLGNDTELYKVCLSDQTGKKVSFGTMDSHLPHTAIHGVGGKGNVQSTVSFKEFLEKLNFSEINIIKIDIEGGERFFTEGLIYLSQIPGLFIFLALHPPFWPDKENVAIELLDVFKRFDLFDSKEQPLLYNELKTEMLSEEKTQYPSKTGRFFDIILKSKTQSDLNNA